MLVMLMASLDSTIVSTALPTITSAASAASRSSWSSPPICSRPRSRRRSRGSSVMYGRKLVLQAALAVFLLGSILCGLARTPTELIAFRAV
jgi:MFS family permease